jgi:hypothetical protein
LFCSENADPILEKSKILHLFDAIVGGNGNNQCKQTQKFVRAAQKKLLNVL